MPLLQGNVNGSISTIALNIPCTVTSFFLINRSIGSVIVNVYIVVDADGTQRQMVVPLNYTMISGTIYVVDVPFKMLAGYYFYITTNGSLDYYITITV